MSGETGKNEITQRSEGDLSVVRRPWSVAEKAGVGGRRAEDSGSRFQVPGFKFRTRIEWFGRLKRF